MNKKLSINAYFTKERINIDGNIDKSVWRNAGNVKFHDGAPEYKRRNAKVYVLWDRKFLYIAFDVDRKNPKAKVTERNGGGLWLDDGIEFLIDAKNDKGKYFMPDDIAYHVNILDAVYDDRGTGREEQDPDWNGNAVHKMKLKYKNGSALGYTCEAAVPWSELGVVPEAGKTVLGIDFCVNGTDDDSGEYHYFDWAGLNVFHYPDGFGELHILDSK